MPTTEQEEETNDRINYFSGMMTLYIKGIKKANDAFTSKSEMKQVMEEWQLEYRFVDGIEIGIIFD